MIKLVLFIFLLSYSYSLPTITVPVNLPSYADRQIRSTSLNSDNSIGKSLGQFSDSYVSVIYLTSRGDINDCNISTNPRGYSDGMYLSWLYNSFENEKSLPNAPRLSLICKINGFQNTFTNIGLSGFLFNPINLSTDENVYDSNFNLGDVICKVNDVKDKYWDNNGFIRISMSNYPLPGQNTTQTNP